MVCGGVDKGVGWFAVGWIKVLGGLGWGGYRYRVVCGGVDIGIGWFGVGWI